MFHHNIDPTLALAAISVIVLMVVAFASVKIADIVATAAYDDAAEDREALARATGMIDTNQYN